MRVLIVCMHKWVYCFAHLCLRAHYFPPFHTHKHANTTDGQSRKHYVNMNEHLTYTWPQDCVGRPFWKCLQVLLRQIIKIQILQLISTLHCDAHFASYPRIRIRHPFWITQNSFAYYIDCSPIMDEAEREIIYLTKIKSLNN